MRIATRNHHRIYVRVKRSASDGLSRAPFSSLTSAVVATPSNHCYNQISLAGKSVHKTPLSLSMRLLRYAAGFVLLGSLFGAGILTWRQYQSGADTTREPIHSTVPESAHSPDGGIRIRFEDLAQAAGIRF